MRPSVTAGPLGAAAEARLRLTVRGRVQGVGFRPFVYRLAHAHGLAGWVRNDAGAVHLEVQGPATACRAFAAALEREAPPLARPEAEAGRWCAPEPAGGAFEIRPSTVEETHDVHVPPDQFACEDCLAELADPRERRYRYPFINCTQCGPRYTIIRALPYDRPATTLAAFPLCPACAAEYGDPLDRRFHAQPLACAACGPTLAWHRGDERATGEAALTRAVAALRAGAVVAARGIGGYHLLCAAGDEAAVGRLRERKRRPAKPFALMVPQPSPGEAGDRLAWVRAIAAPTPAQAAAVASPERPVVLMHRRPDAPLAASIAPGLDEVGVMLPYSPLHQLLLAAFAAPLVATSGNLSGEPVLTDPEEAEARLASVADAFLHHDRPIARPADDPVLREIGGRVRPLRLGRGTAPVELPLPRPLGAVTLATGADLKNTVALGFGTRAVISPHISDLDSARGRRVFARVAHDLPALYGRSVQRIVCDAHPDYRGTRWARARARERDLDALAVAHHAAHASAVAGEFGCLEPMLCLTWDGTGLGEDGTLWGGETLLGRPGAWRRMASLRPFRLPGGDRAAREGWRTALGLCWELGRDDLAASLAASLAPAPRAHVELLRKAWARGFQCPVSSAAGRLFDAAAAFLGVRAASSYEGQAPIELEALAASAPPARPVPLPLIVDPAGLLRIDWQPLVGLLTDPARAPAERARAFHGSLAAAAAACVQRLARDHGVRRVGLAGGVFQNRLFADDVRRALEAGGLEPLLGRALPANDAAIAYGQLVEAACR